MPAGGCCRRLKNDRRRDDDRWLEDKQPLPDADPGKHTRVPILIADLLLRVMAAAVVGFAAGWLIKSVFARGRLERAERSWRRQHEAAKAELDVALHRAEAMEPDCRRLEARNRELKASFKKLTSELDTIRSSFAKREQGITELRNGLAEAQQNMQDTSALRAKLAAQEKKLRELKGLRSELFERALHLSELDSITAERDTLSEHATSLEAENADLHRQKAKFDEELTLARERIASLEQALNRTRAQIFSPPSDPVAAAKIAKLEERLKERNAAVAEMRADLDRLTGNYQDRIRELERRLGDRTGQSITAMIDAPEPPTLNRVSAPEPTQSQKDDMTEISGIGPVLEQTLNGLGIHSYSQLARLTPEDVERFGAQLGPFKWRLMREDWIGQAQRLHKEKYGSKLEH